MSRFLDRRLNPKNKSLSNRRRFVSRVRRHVKHAVDRSLRERQIADVGRGDEVSIPAESILEPHFQHADDTGRRDLVLPGNKVFRAGDRLEKPPTGGGGRGREGAPQGEGEDEFVFVLSRDEFLDIFFEDLQLPDLVKRSLAGARAIRPRRAGISVTGSPGNLNVPRTMRNALARRMALKRPRDSEVAELRERLFALEAVHEPDAGQRRELAEVRDALERLLRRRQRVPYLDPLDVRYTYFEQKPEPNANAVMFCLMDVSASMGAREKDLAKRFFVLLHLFLARRYERVDLVFIRHTNRAREVDEETFFHSRETGGTIVSTALTEMRRVIDARYAPSEWNIYAAQASDGDNWQGDSSRCAAILDGDIMRLCQYFAYVEIMSEPEMHFLTSEESGTDLWQAYRNVAGGWPNFAMKRIARAADIYPVFRELFSRRSADAVDA